MSIHKNGKTFTLFLQSTLEDIYETKKKLKFGNHKGIVADHKTIVVKDPKGRFNAHKLYVSD